MIGREAGKSFAYILGVYLGDGCVSLAQGKYPTFRLNTIDEDFALAVQAALFDLTGKTAWVGKEAVKKSSKPNYPLQCGCPELCNRLVADTDSKRIIPAYVFGWSHEDRVAFIVGLMDSEGFVAHNQHGSAYMGFKSCDVWVPDFIRLLEMTGIRIGKVSQEVSRKPGYKIPTRFHIKLQSWIDAGARFNIQRKQTRVDDWQRRQTSEANTPEAA